MCLAEWPLFSLPILSAIFARKFLTWWIAACLRLFRWLDLRFPTQYRHSFLKLKRSGSDNFPQAALVLDGHDCAQT